MQYFSEVVLETVLENPALFFCLVFTLTYLLFVSLARLVEAKGYNLLNLATREARLFGTILLFTLWLALTYISFIESKFLITLAIFGASPIILLSSLLIICAYIGLTVLFNKWRKGGTVSAGILAGLISILFIYTLSFKPGWACKPMALSGLSFTYACVARAYEYPGNQGLKVDGKQMLYWYNRAAQAGDSEAAYLIALRSKDVLVKQKLFEQAATDGHAKAAYQYSLLQRGKNDSIKWLRFAVDKNVTEAKYELGLRHREGSGVKKDLNLTRQLYLEAAEAGSILAMVSLSQSYQSDSILFSKNIEKHKYWKQKALNEKERRLALRNDYPFTMQEDPFNAYVRARVKHMLAYIDDQEELLTNNKENEPEYLKKKAKLYLRYQDGDILLRKKALVIYTKLANAGDDNSQFELAMLLLKSKLSNREELEQGRQWLVAAANNGHERAVRKITDAYRKGLYGFPIDLIKSLHYSEERQVALTKKTNSSVNRLSQQFAYFESQNIEADFKSSERLKKIKILRGPAENGDANAQYRLAHILMVERKVDESFIWLEKAAKNGNPDAQYVQSQRIIRSPQTPENEDKSIKLAFHYMKEAAKKNHLGAILYLAGNYTVGYKIVNSERNMYQAYVLYNKALSMTNEDVIFANTFGNPKGVSSITRDYVIAKMKEIPESIKRLKLHDLTPAQKKSYVEEWYFKEIENLDKNENPQEYLKIINDQRNALLRSTQ